MNWQQGTKQEKQEHAKRRAAERHLLTLSDQDLREIKNRIQDGTAIFVSRQTGDRSRFYLVFRGTEIVVAYSKRHKTVVTVFPPGCKEEVIGREKTAQKKQKSESNTASPAQD